MNNYSPKAGKGRWLLLLSSFKNEGEFQLNVNVIRNLYSKGLQMKLQQVCYVTFSVNFSLFSLC